MGDGGHGNGYVNGWIAVVVASMNEVVVLLVGCDGCVGVGFLLNSSSFEISYQYWSLTCTYIKVATIYLTFKFDCLFVVVLRPSNI